MSILIWKLLWNNNLQGDYMILKELRLAKGYTQEELANILKISLRQYVRIDNEQTIPRPDILASLISILDMSDAEVGKFIKSVLRNKRAL